MPALVFPLKVSIKPNRSQQPSRGARSCTRPSNPHQPQRGWMQPRGCGWHIGKGPWHRGWLAFRCSRGTASQRGRARHLCRTFGRKGLQESVKKDGNQMNNKQRELPKLNQGVRQRLTCLDPRSRRPSALTAPSWEGWDSFPTQTSEAEQTLSGLKHLFLFLSF